MTQHALNQRGVGSCVVEQMHGQAVAEGVANADQQRRAFAWIVEQACRTYDNPYDPDNPRDEAFLCGRIFVGQQLIKLGKLNTGNLKD